MDREQDLRLLSAYLDGELPAGEREALAARLESDPALAGELAALRALKGGLTQVLAAPAPREDEWERLALGVVARQGERLGWTLLAPGALALLVGALIVFFLDDAVPLWVRLASGAVVAGTLFLVVSALADRLRARRIERYEEVSR